LPLLPWRLPRSSVRLPHRRLAVEVAAGVVLAEVAAIPAVGVVALAAAIQVVAMDLAVTVVGGMVLAAAGVATAA
jgi:hypothetical protein